MIEEVEGGYKVTVGSTLHPMTDAHYIEWIELIAGDEVLRKHLTLVKNQWRSLRQTLRKLLLVSTATFMVFGKTNSKTVNK